MKKGIGFVAVGLAAVMLLAGCATGDPSPDAAASSTAPEIMPGITEKEGTQLNEPIIIDAPDVYPGDNDSLFEPLISEIEEGYSGEFENGLSVCLGLGGNYSGEGRNYGALAFQNPQSGVSGCYVGQLTESGSSLTIKDSSSSAAYTFNADKDGDGYRLDLGKRR